MTIEKEDPELKNDPIALALKYRKDEGSIAEIIKAEDAKSKGIKVPD